ncbi:MAG TPA: HNH endonuclease [Bacteroidia bacterium]|nr:HNH endonuclease [Bacteroidia bacterium]
MKGYKRITKVHDNIIDDIEIALQNVETDIEKQQFNFYADPNYKLYLGVRNDKGYAKWKEEVIKRFKNQCCVCYSKERLVAHHLYSYKYYQELRTDLNNGVCICSTCHELFNKENSNVNTLEQFIEYRRRFKGESHDEVRESFIAKRQLMRELGIDLKPKQTVTKIPVIKLSPEKQQQQDKIVLLFEEFRQTLCDEFKFLEKKYGSEKGIRIDFRNKETTSLSAIRKLLAEIMRLNTLISCNKMKDKTIMASKFHMSYEEFCKKLNDPKEYLNFTPSEITHLNKILSEDYRAEHWAARELVFGKEK